MTGRNLRIASTGLIGILLLALFYPTLKWLVGEWLGNDYYSHGPLVPLISAFLAWRLWVKWPLEQRRIKPATIGLLPLGVGLTVYLYALLQRAYFAASLAMILIIAGLVWYLLGTAALRRFAFPIGFLLFMVPLPFVEPLSVPLAQLTGVSVGGDRPPVRRADHRQRRPDHPAACGAGGRRAVQRAALHRHAHDIGGAGDLPGGRGLVEEAAARPEQHRRLRPSATSSAWHRCWSWRISGARTLRSSTIMTTRASCSSSSALALLLSFSWVLGCREIRDDIF